MGKNMVLRLLEQSIEVVAWNRSPGPVEEMVKAGAVGAESLEDLIKKLEVPRIVWLMLPAGEVTDEYIDELLPLLSPGDLIVDGANSFYKDTLRRAEKIKPTGIHFMDIGVSGGPGGARTGACMMIGGAKEDVDRIMGVVKAASAPQAFGHFGEVGSGHFAKMVHNGIEYGMMEAIGEGAAMLKYGPFKLDLAEVFRVYQHRSVIESRLVGWTQEALTDAPDLAEISSEIKSTGEGEWTVKIAKELGIQTPVIEDSFKVRQNSANDPEDSPEGFRNKVVSAQRGKFGQHPVKKEL
ncbi:MAG: 6-phosphogluconate dehydrogenase related protein [Microgenomates group bacterium Gr01-1014_7]|nr:MAG: 6-phosphogluconate dehydrogenase related protein [Microgenomates group bacterium Gr01-1014_7]